MEISDGNTLWIHDGIELDVSEVITIVMEIL